MYADNRLAAAGREAAAQVGDEFRPVNGTLWYQGHWGFQYYVEELGVAQFWDANQSRCRPGDRMIIPENNTNQVFPREWPLAQVARIGIPTVPWLTTLHGHLGAGFYTDCAGPLPFAFGKVPPDIYLVVQVLEGTNRPPGPPPHPQ
jgi:hypothetical protein